MSVRLYNSIPPNVVEIGNEITQGVVDGLMSASPSPSSGNPYVTVNGAATTYLPLVGGTIGTLAEIAIDGLKGVINGEGLSFSNNDGDHNSGGFNRSGVGFHDDSSGYNSLFSANAWSIASGALQGDDNGIIFPDSSIQTTAATSPDLTGYLTKADNLNSVASKSTARTNLGLTTVATASFATDAQVIAGTSASTVIAPSSAKSLRYTNNGSEIDLTPYTWLSSFTTWAGTRNRLNFPINGTVGIGQGLWTIENGSSTLGQIRTYGMDWTKKVSIVGRFSFVQTSATNNNIFRYTLGKNTTTSFGDLSGAGIGIRCLYGSALEIQCHNGTTLTNYTTSFTPSFADVVFEVRVESDGSGNVTCFVNGTQVGTTTGAPTALVSSQRYQLTMELISASINTNAPSAYGSAFKVNYGY